MIIAVTGGSGFVGSYLINELEKMKLHIINCDIDKGIDITDWDSISTIKKFDVVIHLAAKTFVPESYQNPRDFYFTNIIGTLNILELCRKYDSKIIYASSYVYGNPDYLPVDENHPLKGLNPYAQSKIIGENLCLAYNRDFNLQVIIVRPFNIYGPGQNNKFLIPFILQQAREGLINLKSSKPKRDYVYISDVVDAYLRCIDYNKTPFEVFNIGYGTSYSVQEITDMVAMHFRRKLRISFTEESRKNEIMNTVAGISKAKTELGWEPKIDLNRGIALVIGDP